MKKLLLPALLIAAQAAAFGASARTEEHRPSVEAYTDEDTMAVFPAVIGKFRKQEVIRNYNSLIGTVVRYSDGDGNCADIYIYAISGLENPVSSAVAKQHYNSVRDAILRMPEKRGLVTGAELLSETPVEIGGGGITAAFSITLDGGLPRRTVLTVFPAGNRIVKLRMTGEEKIGGEAFPGMDAFCAEIFRIFEAAAKH